MESCPESLFAADRSITEAPANDAFVREYEQASGFPDDSTAILLALPVALRTQIQIKDENTTYTSSVERIQHYEVVTRLESQNAPVLPTKTSDGI